MDTDAPSPDPTLQATPRPTAARPWLAPALAAALVLGAGCAKDSTAPPGAPDTPSPPPQALAPVSGPDAGEATEANEATDANDLAFAKALAAAKARLAEGDSHGAVAAAWALDQDHPDHPDVLTVMASAYVLAGRAEDALATADRALALAAQAGTPLDGAAVTKAAALHALGRSAEGLPLVRGVLARSPDDVAAKVNLRAMLEATGALDELATLLRADLLALDDASAAPEVTASVRLALARVELALGRTDAALTRALEAVERQPGQAEPHLVAGLVRFETGDFVRAMDRFDIAHRLAGPGAPTLAQEARLAFRGAYYLAVAKALRCAHGPGPWSDAQIDAAVAPFAQEGLAGASSFRDMHRALADAPAIAQRLATLSEGCAAAQEGP